MNARVFPVAWVQPALFVGLSSHPEGLLWVMPAGAVTIPGFPDPSKAPGRVSDPGGDTGVALLPPQQGHLPQCSPLQLFTPFSLPALPLSFTFIFCPFFTSQCSCLDPAELPTPLNTQP